MSFGRGKLIAIDGVDGSGKSSQVKLLADRLKQDYPTLKILVTREPWDVEHNVIGKRIRSTMVQGKNKRVWADEESLNHESLQYLFFLDRCVHYMKLIIPALEKDYLVITDRERMVTYAYGKAARVKVSTIKKWHENMAEPDVYYFVKVSPKTALSRINSRNATTKQDAEIFETREAVIKNIDGFNQITAKGVINNLVTVNGDDDLEAISEEVYNDLKKKLGPWLGQFTDKQEVLFG
jgi:dTMP kinase